MDIQRIFCGYGVVIFLVLTVGTSLARPGFPDSPYGYITSGSSNPYYSLQPRHVLPDGPIPYSTSYTKSFGHSHNHNHHHHAAPTHYSAPSTVSTYSPDESLHSYVKQVIAPPDTYVKKVTLLSPVSAFSSPIPIVPLPDFPLQFLTTSTVNANTKVNSRGRSNDKKKGNKKPVAEEQEEEEQQQQEEPVEDENLEDEPNNDAESDNKEQQDEQEEQTANLESDPNNEVEQIEQNDDEDGQSERLENQPEETPENDEATDEAENAGQEEESAEQENDVPTKRRNNKKSQAKGKTNNGISTSDFQGTIIRPVIPSFFQPTFGQGLFQSAFTTFENPFTVQQGGSVWGSQSSNDNSNVETPSNPPPNSDSENDSVVVGPESRGTGSRNNKKQPKKPKKTSNRNNSANRAQPASSGGSQASSNSNRRPSSQSQGKSSSRSNGRPQNIAQLLQGQNQPRSGGNRGESTSRQPIRAATSKVKQTNAKSQKTSNRATKKPSEPAILRLKQQRLQNNDNQQNSQGGYQQNTQIRQNYGFPATSGTNNFEIQQARSTAVSEDQGGYQQSQQSGGYQASPSQNQQQSGGYQTIRSQNQQQQQGGGYQSNQQQNGGYQSSQSQNQQQYAQPQQQSQGGYQNQNNNQQIRPQQQFFNNANNQRDNQQQYRAPQRNNNQNNGGYSSSSSTVSKQYSNPPLEGSNLFLTGKSGQLDAELIRTVQSIISKYD